MPAATARDDAAGHRAAPAARNFSSRNYRAAAGDDADDGTREHEHASRGRHDPAEHDPAEHDIRHGRATRDSVRDRRPPATPDTTVAPTPPPTDPVPATTAAPTSAPERVEVQLASGTSAADDLESGPTLLPTLALVALGGLLFAAGYWFYVTVLGRR